MRFILTFLMFGFLSSKAEASLLVKAVVNEKGNLVITSVTADKRAVPLNAKKVLRSVPYFHYEMAKNPPETYIEFLIHEKNATAAIVAKLKEKKVFRFQNRVAGTEVRVLLQQGPWENRINFTIVGDGYTIQEKDKFFADAQRIANDLFVKQTFQSYLPLFNITAVFVPSAESGLGDGVPKNTAFKLYRNPKGSKRAIMPGDMAALDDAIDLAQSTTYPIVIANDEYYGGLGGKYSISTSSARSGLIVLRHELGHSIGEVGEEYDGGEVYTGANASPSAKDIRWSHWVRGPLKVNEAAPVTGAYVWQNLKNNPYQATFENRAFPGGYIYGVISSVGWQTPQDVVATLDGVAVPLAGTFNEDRNFYDFGPVVLSSGKHSLSISENIKDGDNVLGFATMWAVPANYDFTPDRVDAYATFDSRGKKSYRPTHSSCLMRTMTSEKFCPVDQENLWLKMLSKVSLIDGVQMKPSVASGLTAVSLKTLDLPNLEIQWLQETVAGIKELAEFKNQKEITAPKGSKLKVKVNFQTQEVLVQSRVLQAEKSFTVQ